MIHLDTNFLVGALVPGTPAENVLLSWLDRGEVLGMSAVAWGEYMCGPVSPAEQELALQTVSLLESFLPADAEKAAELFNLSGRRPRSFQDCLIAATAIRRGAALATLNKTDFTPFLSHGLILI